MLIEAGQRQTDTRTRTRERERGASQEEETWLKRRSFKLTGNYLKHLNVWTDQSGSEEELLASTDQSFLQWIISLMGRQALLDVLSVLQLDQVYVNEPQTQPRVIPQ